MCTKSTAYELQANSLILEKILEYLEVPELKHFRSVSKFWNNMGTPVMAEKVDMTLEGNRLDLCLEAICKSQPSSFTLFTSLIIKINSLQSINPTINIMWTTIHLNLKHLYLHITTLYARRQLTRLLFLHFPSLASLKLMVMKYWGEEDVLQMDNATTYLDNIHRNLNMKHFQLSYLGTTSLYGFDGSNDKEFEFPINWQGFFKRFPDLHHIGLVGVCNLDIGKMLEALLQLQLEGSQAGASISSVEILDENAFPQSPSDEHLLQITKLQNKLESVHLEISPFATTSLLRDFLKKHTNSLKNLRLRKYPFNELSFPLTLTENQFYKVSFLELSENLLPSLDFLPFMPSLERLHVIIRDYSRLQCCSIIDNTTDPLRISHSGVRFLYIEPPLISTDCIDKLSQCLPKLEYLKFRASNEMLSRICTIAGSKSSSPSWKGLRKLHIISWDGLTDEGITGISEQTLNFWGGFSSNTEVKNYRCKPFIGDILGLKSLTIEMWNDYANHISDFSIYYGVDEVENLEDVTFVRCGISSTAYSSIKVRNKVLVQ